MVEYEYVEVTYRLSKQLAEAMAEQGVLEDSAFVENTLRAKLKMSRAWEKLHEVFRQADADPEQMTMEEVVVEIKAYRAEKRAQKT